MKIRLNGAVVDNDTAFMYDFFDMDNISPKAINDKLDSANGEDLDISINSNGGDVFAASEIYTELKQYTGNVTISVTGIAASAASVISMAADTLKMSPTAQIMIHNAASTIQGDTHDMQHESGVLNNVNNSIANAYVNKTGMDKQELLNLMDNETWLTAEQAKNYGFADEVMFDEAPAVQFVNAIAPIPNHDAVAKFKQLIMDRTKEEPQGDDSESSNETSEKSEAKSESLLEQKLKILRGE